ncbi:sulfatase [Photobacterium sp. DNB22_13_2]
MKKISYLAKKKNSTVLLCAALALGLQTNISVASELPTNVLVFLVDDLRVDIGSYGHNQVQTPNIDKLASEGMQFNKAYVQQAICGPSRVSILTGLRPETTGLYTINDQGRLRPNQPNLISMPQLFKEHGYKTISIGKVFHHTTDDADKWTTQIEKLPNFYSDPEKKRNKFAYDVGDVDDDFYKDGQVARDAVRVLNEIKDDPFLMVVGFSKPHLPFNAPKRYWDLYETEQFAVPSRAVPDNMPALSLTNWNELRSYGGIPKEGYCDDLLTKTLTHAYYASVSYMDAQLGRVMTSLDDLGLRENTMVVLMGDNGYKLGQYGAWNKHSNMELDTKVPLIISRETNHKSAAVGKQSNSIAEGVDIFPTVIEAAGLPMPNLDGVSLLPIVDDPSKEVKDLSYSVFAKEARAKMGVTVTDGTWRYSEWRVSETQEILSRELYSHAESDIATSNVIDIPEYESIQAELTDKLHDKFPVDAPSFNDRPIFDRND